MDFIAAVNVPTVVVTLVLVLFYDVPIKNFFRAVRSRIKAAGNGPKG